MGIRRRLDDQHFYEALSEEFEMRLLSQSLLHAEFRRHGVGSFLIHVLRKKEAKIEKSTLAAMEEKKKELDTEGRNPVQDAKLTAVEGKQGCNSAKANKQGKAAQQPAAAEEEQELDSV